MNCPCRGCEKRRPGCHGACDEYGKWREKFEAMKVAKEADGAVLSVLNGPVKVRYIERKTRRK